MICPEQSRGIYHEVRMAKGRTTQTISVRLKDEEAELVKSKAKRADVSLNQWVRKALLDRANSHKGRVV